MRISEILAEAKKVHLDIDDVDEKPEDADSDKIPHIVMQLRKALDVDGDYPITFKDGKKVKLQLDNIKHFLSKYLKAKPSDRESLQNIASQSLSGFHDALKQKDREEVKHKIKGSRHMSHFSGDFDDK
jgi:hypothetical protein